MTMKNIPVIMTIFGGSGDLAHRKLYSALFNLFEQGLIKDNFAVIGTARRPWSHEYLREQVIDAVHENDKNVDENHLKQFASHFYYQSHDVTNTEHYQAIKDLANDLDSRYSAQGNRIFYMAMAPRFFGTIATHINDQKLIGSGFNRIVVEKPFGRDFASASELNEEIKASFSEDSVYRIDHYLGKEMIQNILPMRLSNPLIKNIWSGEFIKNVQVTLAENLGVEARGGYYETSGALRDMVQNHIFQIITLLAMGEPTALSSEAIHAKKQELLDSMIIPSADEVKKAFVRAQYAGTDDTFGYLQEPNVDPNSKTETFAAGKVKFTKGPLANVPIYFRTGKKMREKKNRIDIVLKHMNNLYGQAHSNNITIIIDPKSEIYFTINGKRISEPGIRRENLAYEFSDYENSLVPDGYERLLHDVFVGDQTNFTHWSELAKFWEFIDAVEAAWQSENESVEKLIQYPQGKLGPKQASEIFESPTERWIYE